MTIDLLTSDRDRGSRAWNRASTEAALRGLAPPAVTDVIVVFGGWGGYSEGGAPLDPGGPTTGTTKLLRKLEALQSESGHRIAIKSWQGALGTSAIVEAKEFVNASFHPLGKFVITGYSVGGQNALSLAWTYNAQAYYNATQRRFSYVRPRIVPGGDVIGLVRVDLLFTIDIARGPASGRISRSVPASARRNVNRYQTLPSSIYSHGGPTRAMDPSMTEIDNQDFTDRYRDNPGAGHGTIDDDTLDEVVREVGREIGAAPR